jgi:hypothetical protein
MFGGGGVLSLLFRLQSPIPSSFLFFFSSLDPILFLLVHYLGCLYLFSRLDFDWRSQPLNTYFTIIKNGIGKDQILCL